jgi:hypothetical protein
MKKIFSLICATAILLNTLFAIAFEIPQGMQIPEGMQIPDGMQIPEGLQIPEGMQIPEGLQIPEGVKIPDGLQIPEGIKIPDGMKIPDGLQIPEGMQLPDGIQMPEGLDPNLINTYTDMLSSKIPKNEDLGLPEKFNLEEIIKSKPDEIESILTQNLFKEDLIGVIDINEISSSEETNKMNSYKVDTSTFEGKIENSVIQTFEEEIENILPEISAVILSEIEKKMDSILEVIMNKGITEIKVKTTADDSDFSKIPPENIIKKIPADMLPTVRARVQVMVTEEIHAQMKDAVLETQKNTRTVIDACKDDIKEIIKGVVKNIVPQVAKIIQNTVDTKIEQKVYNAMLDANIVVYQKKK